MAVCAGTAAGFAGGVTSGILSGQDLGGVMKSGLIGAGTGLVCGALGGVASTVAPAGALWGSLYGAGTGSVIGGVGSVMTGGDIKEGIIFGAAAGLVGGGFQGYCSAKSQGLNPWTGKNLTKPAGGPSNLIADEGGSYSVYQGVNEDGEVKYIGITKRDPQVRWGEHLNSGTERATLMYDLVEGATGLSKTNAHIWEQNLINHYGLNNLYNKINSIEPRYWPQYNIQP